MERENDLTLLERTEDLKYFGARIFFLFNKQLIVRGRVHAFLSVPECNFSEVSFDLYVVPVPSVLKDDSSLRYILL